MPHSENGNSVRIPSLIRALAKQAGVSLVGDPSSDQPTSFTNFMTPELKQAYFDADYATINAATTNAANDLNPIYTSIQQNQQNAFSPVTDSDGTPYYIAFSGPAENPTGYMWTYSQPQQPNPSGAGGVTYNASVNCGTLSMSSSILGVSSWIFTSKVVLAPSIIASIVMTMVTKTIYKTLMGQALEDAADAAGVEMSEELVADGTIAVADADMIAIACTALVGGLVVGAIAFFLLLFIFNFLFKNFQLNIRIYNWDDQHSWQVTTEYGSNEEVSGGGNFQQATLSKSSDKVKLPNGIWIPSANQEVSYANYNYTNVDGFMNGVGVAMSVLCDDGNGFSMKYIVHFFSANQMGFSSNLGQSTKDFYNAGWMSNSTMQYLGTVDNNGVQVFMSTPALGGADQDIYYFDVHIGRTGAPPVARTPPKAHLGPKTRNGKSLLNTKPVPADKHITLPNGLKLDVAKKHAAC